MRQDEEGYVWVVDRKKDMIISGGENIYCAEVENVLAAHPEIAEVAVIGRAGREVGRGAVGRGRRRAIRTTRRPRPTSRRSAASGSPRYKHPRDLVIVAALPRNPSGKVLKTRLRDDHGGAACPT